MAPSAAQRRGSAGRSEACHNPYPTPLAVAPPAVCVWTTHELKYPTGTKLAGGAYFTKVGAKAECLELGAACAAVSCMQFGTDECQVAGALDRNGSPAELRTSSFQVSYTPSAACFPTPSGLHVPPRLLCLRLGPGVLAAGGHSRQGTAAALRACRNLGKHSNFRKVILVQMWQVTCPIIP